MNEAQSLFNGVQKLVLDAIPPSVLVESVAIGNRASKNVRVSSRGSDALERQRSRSALAVPEG